MTEKSIGFSVNLKELRKKEGLTRKQLADKMMYSEKAIEKWESGSSLPPVATVCRLAEYFGISVDNLIYAQGAEIKYLLGIDGGGTKTEFLLTDTNGKEIDRLILGPSNPNTIGMEECKKLLGQGISKICRDIDITEVSLFAGLAGGISSDNDRRINKFLSALGFKVFANSADTASALEIALKGGDGVAVIMGTGMIAFSQHKGKQHRIGGWGYLIDRGGSGYHFGADALDSAYKYIDGRQGSKIIAEMLENQLNKPLPEAIPSLYNGGNAYIASFASVVFEAFKQGDKYAEEIIDKNIKEVAEIIKAGISFLPDGKGRAVICGGLTKQSDILRPFFEKYLDDSCQLEFNPEPMVNGAVSLARKLMLKEME